VLVAIVTAFVTGILTKSPVRVDVIRDRATMTREVAGGLIENAYSLHFMNVSEKPASYQIGVSGLDGIQLSGPAQVTLDPASARTLQLQVQVPPASAKDGANPIYFDIQSTTDASVKLREKATFLQVQ
jgi:polyferredoxin